MTPLAGPPTISLWALALASSLLLLQGGISVAFRLGLERTLALAAVRMTAQLAVIGFVLQLVFEQMSAWWVLPLAAVMISAATWEVLARQGTQFRGLLAYGLSGGLMLLAGGLTTVLAVGLLLGAVPWYSPRVVVPILGMILGNAMTGVALTLDGLTYAAQRDRAGIEARIALGHARLDAFRAPLRQALRTGLMPLINSMAAAGIVSLPGMMTGQILAGVDPLEAAKYQVLIMFLLAGATALGVLGAGLGGIHLLTDSRQRLRLDRLVEAA